MGLWHRKGFPVVKVQIEFRLKPVERPNFASPKGSLVGWRKFQKVRADQAAAVVAELNAEAQSGKTEGGVNLFEYRVAAPVEKILKRGRR